MNYAGKVSRLASALTASAAVVLAAAIVVLRLPMGQNEQWHEVAVNDLATFSSPVALEPGATAGIDSAVGEWRGPDLLVRTDYGLFSDPLTGYRNRPALFQSDERIDGQPARVVAFDQEDGSRFSAAHFYDLGELGRAPNKLTFVVITTGARSGDEVLAIIRSIRFRR